MAGVGLSISGAFQILLPVAPVLVERVGPHGAGGAATAALFSGAVAGEVLTPWLMSRWSAARLLIAGQLIYALFSLAYVYQGAPAWIFVGAAGARGVGFGIAIVVSVVLVGDSGPATERGRSMGVFGLALSLPGIVAPAIGVWLLAAGQVEVVAAIGFLSGLGGAVLAWRLRGHPPRPENASNLLVVGSHPGLVAMFAGLVLASCTLGAVITYVPIALPASGLGSAATFLLMYGIARAAGRWYGGVLGDRHPIGWVVLGSLALCAAGLVLLASRPGELSVAIAAAAYGIGYGAVQTGSYLAMAEKVAGSYANVISALWNVGVDLGASAGGVLIGLSAALLGYSTAIWLLVPVLLLAVPLFGRPARKAA